MNRNFLAMVGLIWLLNSCGYEERTNTNLDSATIPSLSSIDQLASSVRNSSLLSGQQSLSASSSLPNRQYVSMNTLGDVRSGVDSLGLIRQATKAHNEQNFVPHIHFASGQLQTLVQSRVSQRTHRNFGLQPVLD